MRICENSLTTTKNRTEGGQPLYSFGSKKCEMHKFQNVTLNLPDPPPAPAVTVEQSKNIEESLAAKKLKELDSLLASKLITNEEYEKKRKEIIDGL
jgi:esterase/lipase superfamily enzyme